MPCRLLAATSAVITVLVLGGCSSLDVQSDGDRVQQVMAEMLMDFPPTP